MSSITTFAVPVSLSPRAVRSFACPFGVWARPGLCTRIRPARSQEHATRMHHAAAVDAKSYSSEERGAAETTDFRLFISSSGKQISPWHDIPIYPDPSNTKVVNFVNEIPKGTQAKMELATDEEKNPIKQDVKKGALRFYKYGPSLINYGAIPQTYEDPGSVHPELNVGGDGDPIDLLDIGNAVQPFGAVYSAKILGTLALLDEGEIDWKIIAINIEDPIAEKLNDIHDVEELMPGKVSEIREWFRMYKTAEGKGENEYAYNGEAKDAGYAARVVAETHESWSQLRSGAIDNDNNLWIK
jgi:inorganic pyrophosphatase